MSLIVPTLPRGNAPQPLLRADVERPKAWLPRRSVGAINVSVARLRRHTDLPLCIGFGIRTPEHAAEVARRADGAVVGSALIDRFAKAGSKEQAVSDVLGLCRELAKEVRETRK